MAEEAAASEKGALLASMSEMLGALQRQENLMKELTLWIRLGVTDEAKHFFEEILDTDTKKWVYEALDGRASQSKIQENTSVRQGLVSRWGKEWEALGIVVDEGGGKRRKVTALSALGIEVPPLPDREGK